MTTETTTTKRCFKCRKDIPTAREYYVSTGAAAYVGQQFVELCERCYAIYEMRHIRFVSDYLSHHYEFD